MNRQPIHLKLRDFLEDNGRFIVGRYFYNRHTRAPLHDHDFAEVFWVSRGRCRQVLDGSAELLQPGDVRFVRPEHVHSIEHAGGEPLQLTNIAFPAAVLDSWERDYPVLQGHFFWIDGPRPGGLRLPASRLEELREKTHRLAARSDELLFLHGFLFDLFQEELPAAPDTRNIPGWLKDGLAALDNPETFRAGPTGFARACGRSPEHVSRACRRFLDTTPGDLVNAARMKDAARQLRMTNNDILNIMFDCGFSNPSHFYKLFKQRYGETPRRYRLNQRQVVGQ